MKPVFVTGNQAKADYLARWLGIPLEHRKLHLDELQSLNLEEIVEHKARQAYELIQRPVLIEDVSLTFTAMGRLPGPLIKWFLEELGVEGLARLAGGLAHRRAKAEVMYALYDGSQLHTFHGEQTGEVATKPRGNRSNFGWNQVFIPAGYAQTYAELTPEEFHAVSHRGRAVERLRAFLTQ